MTKKPTETAQQLVAELHKLCSDTLQTLDGLARGLRGSAGPGISRFNAVTDKLKKAGLLAGKPKKLKAL